MALTCGMLDVFKERLRQVTNEGFTPSHDDAHKDGELAKAAACYAADAAQHPNAGFPPLKWPWATKWWKPQDHRRNCVRAAALLLAEIDRLDRADTARLVQCPSPLEQFMSLAWDAFGEINARRNAAFGRCKDWTDADWAVALAGEVGELLNVVKKIRRDGSSQELQKKFEDEAADVQAYLSLWCALRDVRLGSVTVRKFNEVTQRMLYRHDIISKGTMQDLFI